MQQLPSATKNIRFLQESSFLVMISPVLTAFSLKQSIALSTYSSDSFSKILLDFKALKASFLRMIKGKLLPRAFSISQIPKAITQESSAVLMVYLLTPPLVKLAYSSNESPFIMVPLNQFPLNLLSFPDFNMYMEAANSPSLQISLFLSNL